MSTFLETPELVGLVMEAATQFSERKSKETLSACSTVNRCFAQEALRILWGELKNLDPLMRLLPNDAVSYAVERKRLKLEYQRDIVISDWDRILFYAQFVRVLRATKWITLCLSFTKSELLFLNSFISLFPQSFLFPGLLQLEGWVLKEPQVVALLLPSLPQIRVELPLGVLENMRQILTRIWDMKSLKQISLGERGMVIHYLGYLFRSQQETTQITDLTLDSLIMTFEIFSNIHSNIPHLERLSLSLHPEFLSSKTSAALQFTQLKELDLKGPLKGCIDVIRDLRIHPSEIISVWLKGEASPELYTELLSAIGQMESINLWFIDIRLHPDYVYMLRYGLTEAISGISLGGGAIYPLLKFTELQVLKLRFGFPVFVEDEDFTNILHALPDIRHLHIMGTSSEQRVSIRSVPRMTPECLKHIAYAAPQLLSVSVWVTPEWNRLVEVLDGSPSPSCLRKLDVGLSRLNLRSNSAFKASDVLRALSDCFPGLEVFDFTGRAVPDLEWQRIRRSLLFDEPFEDLDYGASVHGDEDTVTTSDSDSDLNYW